MIRRQLTIRRISEEQLRGLMHVAQGLCLRENNYFIITEDIDWLIVIHVLFEQEIIHKGVLSSILISSPLSLESL